MTLTQGLKARGVRRDDLIAGWSDRIIVIWEEDDARPPDREMASEAFKRIFGRNAHEMVPLDSYDPKEDDWFAKLYDHGRVLGHSYEGGFVGVLATITDDEGEQVL